MDGSGSPCCLSDHGAGIHPVCLPEPWHAQRMMLDELSFLARERQWDAIIDKYRESRSIIMLA